MQVKDAMVSDLVTLTHNDAVITGLKTLVRRGNGSCEGDITAPRQTTSQVACQGNFDEVRN
jgi:hypothetical protein